MKRRNIKKIFNRSTIQLLCVPGVLMASWACIENTNAEERVQVSAPCGVVENLVGDVQILDAARTHLLDSSHAKSIPCGAWVSVNQGWAQIRHQNGPHVHLSSDTFVQFLKGKPLANSKKDDHLVLYRGSLYVQAGGGEEEFRIASASARARVKRGKIIFLFNFKENETQLIALENSASLENRFQASRKVVVQEGEATELNFNLLKIIPSLPKSVSVATLRPKLAQLHVAENDQFESIQAVLKRQSRKFAANLLEEESDPRSESHGPHKVSVADRRLASVTTSDSESDSDSESGLKAKKSNYVRHKPSPEDPVLKKQMLQKIAGGDAWAKDYLFPKSPHSKAAKQSRAGASHSAEENEDPSDRLTQGQKLKDAAEKKELIEKLSQVRANE